MEEDNNNEDNWDDGDPYYLGHASKKLLTNVTAEELRFFFILDQMNL